MDQNETLSAGDDGLPVDDSGDSSASKRLKFPSAKVSEHYGKASADGYKQRSLDFHR